MKRGLKKSERRRQNAKLRRSNAKLKRRLKHNRRNGKSQRLWSNNVWNPSVVLGQNLNGLRRKLRLREHVPKRIETALKPQPRRKRPLASVRLLKRSSIAHGGLPNKPNANNKSCGSSWSSSSTEFSKRAIPRVA